MLYRRELLGEASPLTLRYTSSMEYDKLIACEVLEVMGAYIEELRELKVVPEDAANRILGELENLIAEPSKLFHIKAEDVHEAIEVHLKEKLGSDAGYIGLGRSRNDHVAAALRLKVSRLLLKLLKSIVGFRRTLLSRASASINVLIPLYTHSQPAQISTLAHYFLYIDEMLSDYSSALVKALDITVRSPLGSGPAAGVMAPLDRGRLASKLFGGMLAVNTLYASGGREFSLITLALVSSLLVSLSRVAEDFILFSLPQVGYFKLPAGHLATSSIMPHKVNPVTMEIVRAKAGGVLGKFVSVASIVKGIPSGYNLDLQEANRPVIEALMEAIDTLEVLRDAIENVEVNAGAVEGDIKRYPLLASDIAELIALKAGKPFREAHKELAKLVKEAKNTEELYNRVREAYNINLNPKDAVKRPVNGSPSPENVKSHMEKSLKNIEEFEAELSKYSFLEKSRC